MVNRDTLLLVYGTVESRSTLRAIFENTYNILEADNTSQSILLLNQNHPCIASVILDTTGQNLLTPDIFINISKNPELIGIPVLVITPGRSPADVQMAFDLGATDVIRAPYSATILRHRLQVVVDLHLYKRHFENLVEEQACILRHSNEVMVDALSSIIEHRNVESGHHIARIRHFTEILLHEVARSCHEYHLTDEVIQIICSASALHDVGKISIPDAILNKPEPLTPEEREVIQTHTIAGCRILESLSSAGNPEYLGYAHEICHYHHERWDGGGYPEGLRGDDIPISAQVVGLADAYDALINDRVYKKAIPPHQSANMILNGECGAFSPKLLECFKQVNSQFVAVAKEYPDEHTISSDKVVLTLPDVSIQAGSDTLQTTQIKYQSILHYINGTVFEVDLDQSTYHLIYNPDPNLLLFNSSFSFYDILHTMIKHIIVKEDHGILKRALKEDIPAFLRDGLRRQQHYFRVHSQSSGEPVLYQVTLFRLDQSESSRHRIIVIWQQMSPQSAGPGQDILYRGYLDIAMRGMLDNLCTLYNDRWLTLAHSCKNLTVLLGYTAEELRVQFQNHLIELVHPDDRQALLQSISEQLTRGIDVALECRMRNRKGNYIWILTKGNLYTDTSGHEYLYGLMSDISSSKAAEEHLKLTLDRHAIILSQTENVIFEWDMVTDSIEFSSKFQEIFGYDPLTEHIRDRIHTDTHIHPEDISMLVHKLEALTSGETYQEAELRIAKSDGRYLWCQVRITVQYDTNGLPFKLVGIIINIDNIKRASQALQDRAERDALTHLLNKATGQHAVEDHLLTASKNGGSPCALFIIDLDNFKQVNDQYGHMFGDAVIAQAASEIRKLFRSNDIVARIGGDEFMVLMKDIPSLQLVKDRLEKLLSVFRTIFESRLSSCNLSCSVGAALFPQHATSYQELFLRADQSLYQVKAQGKNNYLIFDDKLSPHTSKLSMPTSPTSPIDSDKQPSLTYDTLVRYAFQQLYESGDLSQAINNVLDLVGRQMNVSRVYIFENNDDNTTCSNTFEWCNTGISPAIHTLQNISYITDVPNYDHNFDENGIFYCPDISTLSKDIYDILDAQGIKSMLQCSIRDNGIFRGYVGFDECETARLWSQEQINTLTFFSEMLSVFLLKKRAQDKAQRRAADLTTALDNQNAWTYVIDPDTYQIRFINKKIKDLVPSAREGMYCYHCLANRSSPCLTCPVAHIRSSVTDEQIISNPRKDGTLIHCEAVLIQWEEQDACMITCRELSGKFHPGPASPAPTPEI